ncbi:MAG TPA: phosphorylated adapter RNA export RNA-binding domain-containing protein, partial [Herpetosiphonaceae bacterium]|nr:phosphorylated adapter RNA export RNA-binding domain-containing protein [Herpetosiphonaceae bacterium]
MTSSTDIRGLVRTIAQQLGETQPGPIQQIRRIVQRLGADVALAILQETQQIEAQGGQLLPDGSRRRTPGGVFFTLVKDRVSPKDRAAI